MIAQAGHRQVIGLGQSRLAVGSELEQALLERGQVDFDLRLGLGGQATQVGGHHIGHAPHVVTGLPWLAVQAVGGARLHGNSRQTTVHRAGGVDFDDADIAAPGHRVQRVIRPQRAQADGRVGVQCQGVQCLRTAPGEIGDLP